MSIVLLKRKYFNEAPYDVRACYFNALIFGIGPQIDSFRKKTHKEPCHSTICVTILMFCLYTSTANRYKPSGFVEKNHFTFFFIVMEHTHSQIFFRYYYIVRVIKSVFFFCKMQLSLSKATCIF